MTAEVTVDDVDWGSGDSTLLYDPKYCFPPEELVALARAHARCPGLVHREAVARVLGLDGVGVGDSGGSSSTADGGAEHDTGLDQEPGYVTVESSEELDYVLVGTADEVERERRREADAEAELEAGWNDRVRSIEQLLDDDDEEEAAPTARQNSLVRSVERFLDLDEDAITARQSNLIRDIDRSLEEEAARDAAWNTVFRIIEQHFQFRASTFNNEADVRPD